MSKHLMRQRISALERKVGSGELKLYSSDGRLYSTLRTRRLNHIALFCYVMRLRYAMLGTEDDEGEQQSQLPVERNVEYDALLKQMSCAAAVKQDGEDIPLLEIARQWAQEGRLYATEEL